MNARTVSEDDLHAYVDGQLDGNRRLAVERWLADDADAARRAEDYRTQTALLHDLFDTVLREPPTDAEQDLTDRLKGRLAFNDNRPVWHARPVVRWAAAVMLVIAGAGGGWFGRGAQGRRRSPSSNSNSARRSPPSRRRRRRPTVSTPPTNGSRWSWAPTTRMS